MTRGPDVCIVIPARHASARFPGKPLVPLRGVNGRCRSLLERTVIAGRNAIAAAGDEIALLVATDDGRIEAEARRIGADVVLTDPECRNGTERVAQAVLRAGLGAGIIVNLQGDAPLTPPSFVLALVAALRARPASAVATPVLRCDAAALARMRADRSAGRVGATTAVFDRSGRALYFSKEILPHLPPQADPATCPDVFHHVGLYAYRREALAQYAGWAPGPLEVAEGLEQLRFLENGHHVDAVEVAGADFWEVNNPTDVPVVESLLAALGID